MQATTVDCLGHTITDEVSSLETLKTLYQYDTFSFSFSAPSLDLLIGSKYFLFLSLSTLEYFGFGKGMMSVIAVPTDVPYHVQEEYHHFQGPPRLFLCSILFDDLLVSSSFCHRGL
jgi:hypothetical protein